MAQREPGLLRFVACGSVDDGKSTLIGRLLYESKMIFDDQLKALAEDSRRHGTQGSSLDFALILDGLAAEREQGITIDVAYRQFSLGGRRCMIADAPGHEQYTRNMITGASTADAAVVLVDVRKGVVTQTLRHGYLAHLMGVSNIAFAVNKMDLVGYEEERFRAAVADCHALARRLALDRVAVIPVSALEGDNILGRSGRMPWYTGETVADFLRSVDVDHNRARRQPFRLPVQWVNRPSQEFRGFSGRIAGGSIRPGERVRVLPSGSESTVARIVTHDGDLPIAAAGESVTVTFNDEIDVSRGDMLVAANEPAGVADQFEATMIWMGRDPMLGGRPYLMKIGTATVIATPAAPKYCVDVNTFQHIAARKLEVNEIGVCNLSLDRPVAFDPYAENRETGGFILMDRLTNDTVGAGLLHFALRRAQNIHVQAVDVDKALRADQKGQKACVVWFTGFSGAGKSTVANVLERKLLSLGRHTYLLDGDNVRHGLNRDLGFTDADRVENVRRVAEVARLMVDAGLIVIVSLISPFRNERLMARELVRPDEFIEVFMDTPLEVAERRDPKGLYKLARMGKLKNFTGIDSSYESPENPEVRINGAIESPESAVDRILALLAGLTATGAR